MQQHVYYLGYVTFVLVMYSLSGLVLYRTRPDKEYICKEPDQVRNTSVQNQTGQGIHLYRTRPDKEYITNTKET